MEKTEIIWICKENGNEKITRTRLESRGNDRKGSLKSEVWFVFNVQWRDSDCNEKMQKIEIGTAE